MKPPLKMSWAMSAYLSQELAILYPTPPQDLQHIFCPLCYCSFNAQVMPQLLNPQLQSTDGGPHPHWPFGRQNKARMKMSQVLWILWLSVVSCISYSKHVTCWIHCVFHPSCWLRYFHNVHADYFNLCLAVLEHLLSCSQQLPLLPKGIRGRERTMIIKNGWWWCAHIRGWGVLAPRVITDSEMKYKSGYVKEAPLRIKDSEITISICRGKGQVKDMPS